MAGLIQQQMGGAADPAMQEQMPAGSGAEMEESGADESDPNFQQALNFAMEALYSKGAAKDVAKSLKAAQSPIDGVANVAYDVTSIVDERTDGSVPDELLMLLGMRVLEEVVEIADAAGLQMSPVDIASAFKQMTLRYLGEQGMDTSQLEQAMNNIDPSLFEKAAQGEKVQA